MSRIDAAADARRDGISRPLSMCSIIGAHVSHHAVFRFVVNVLSAIVSLLWIIQLLKSIVRKCRTYCASGRVAAAAAEVEDSSDDESSHHEAEAAAMNDPPTPNLIGVAIEMNGYESMIDSAVRMTVRILPSADSELEVSDMRLADREIDDEERRALAASFSMQSDTQSS
jgi:hypothetical protein